MHCNNYSVYTYAYSHVCGSMVSILWLFMVIVIYSMVMVIYSMVMVSISMVSVCMMSQCMVSI